MLDKNLVLSDKTAGRLAAKIQRYKPENVSCINSAHIYALDVLDDRKLANDVVPILRGLISQGFPTIKDDALDDQEHLLLSEMVYALEDDLADLLPFKGWLFDFGRKQ